jgi:hypothetical protein
MVKQVSKVALLRQERLAYWGPLIDEQSTSGLTVASFCRGRGLPIWSFKYWRKIIDGKRGGESGFVELKRREELSPSSGVWVECSRARVHVAPSFDAATLRRVVDVLS